MVCHKSIFPVHNGVILYHTCDKGDGRTDLPLLLYILALHYFIINPFLLYSVFL